jgi:DNA-binding PadR family transcriptional regulator
VLFILKENDNYGYAIIQRMKEITNGKLEWQEATVYPLLTKLEKEGSIKSYWSTIPGVRARRYYSIEEKGIKKLYENKEEWDLAHEILNKFWNFK